MVASTCLPLTNRVSLTGGACSSQDRAEDEPVAAARPGAGCIFQGLPCTEPSCKLLFQLCDICTVRMALAPFGAQALQDAH